MSNTVFELVTGYGAALIFVSSYLSCLALPIPTSIVMLAGGAFVTTGDLSFGSVFLAAWVGAVLGDQTGYAIGRLGGAPIVARLARAPARAKLLNRARALVDRRGTVGVFLSTWLFAPLGPWVNFLAGTAEFAWARFTVADVAGETIWVALYIGLGMSFATQIDAVASIMGNLVGLLAALGAIAGLGLWIRTALRRH
jgi:membrane protein DedA with SNARE-associated domain